MLPSLSRRDREQLRHREEILTAAERVFSEKGFYNATMEDIASASEFAIGSLYKHFRSKDAILGAIFEEKAGRWMDEVESLMEQDEPFLSTFDQFLNHFTLFSITNHNFFRLFHQAHATVEWHKPEHHACLNSLMERYERALGTLMQRGVSEGALLVVDPADLTAYVLGALQGFMFRTVRDDDVGYLQRTLPVIRRLLLSGAGRAPTELIS